MALTKLHWLVQGVINSCGVLHCYGPYKASLASPRCHKLLWCPSLLWPLQSFTGQSKVSSTLVVSFIAMALTKLHWPVQGVINSCGVLHCYGPYKASLANPRCHKLLWCPSLLWPLQSFTGQSKVS